jgi:hypothetical protein
MGALIAGLAASGKRAAGVVTVEIHNSPEATAGNPKMLNSDFLAHALDISPRRLAIILSTTRFGSSRVIRCRIGSGVIW